MWRNLSSPRSHRFENSFEFELRLLLIQTPPGGMSDAIDDARRGNEGLARNAAVIKAVASHFISFNKRDTSAKSGCAGGGYESSSAATDNNDIIEALRSWHDRCPVMSSRLRSPSLVMSSREGELFRLSESISKRLGRDWNTNLPSRLNAQKA